MKYPSTFDLTIVIPAYNEEKRIGDTLRQLSDFLKNDKFVKKLTVEVLVVAANPTDSTHTIAKSFSKDFLHFQLLKPGLRVGKGRDVMFGMQQAKGTAVLFMDADLATPLHHIPEFYKQILGEQDIVVGTRNLKEYRKSKFRNHFSYFGNRLYGAISGIDLVDTQCGFKMFSQRAVDICFKRLTIMGWTFDLEILTIAMIHGLKIKAIPVNDWEDKPYSTYTDNVGTIAVRMIRDFSVININKLRGMYKK